MLVPALCVCFSDTAYAAPGDITTVAGTGTSGYNGDTYLLATSTALNNPSSICKDSSGRIFIADRYNNRIRMIDTSGNIYTVAGTGAAAYGGDGGAATSAQLNQPIGIYADLSGNIFVAELLSHRIRMFTVGGNISTVAGTGAATYGGDGGAATAAQLNFPVSVYGDSSGNIFVADHDNNRIRMFTVGGNISTVAGTGAAAYGGDGGLATSAQLNKPVCVYADSSGNIFVADRDNFRIRMFTVGGNISTVAGTGTAGSSGDGGPATSAQLKYPYCAYGDSSGNIFVADRDSHCIRKFTVGGTISTVAGTGTAGYSGDGGAATAAKLNQPLSICADLSGNIFVAEEGNQRIRKFTVGGTISTVAGNGTGAYTGDSSPSITALTAQLKNPLGVCKDSSGNIFVADQNNHRIRMIDTSGNISTVAGTGTVGSSGDGGPATAAQLQSPNGVYADSSGNIFIAESGGHRIRKFTVNGTISTLAGTGTAGYNGDSIAATAAKLNTPNHVYKDSWGRIFIADQNNHRIRMIDTSGIITTVAGTGLTAYNGDGIAATSANLNAPYGGYTDSSGNIFIGEYGNNRIRKFTVGGNISTIGGTGTAGFSGDGGPATAALLKQPIGIYGDSSGNIFFVDGGNYRIRCIDTAGNINTVAGTGTAGFSGDGGPATAANLYPSRLYVDSSGNIFIGEWNTSRVRMVFGMPTPGYGSAPLPGATINVGTAAVGSPVSTALAVSETGTATLNVTSHALTGTNPGDFSVTPATLSIADGVAAQNLTIQCVPGDAGLRTATLTVNHNAGASATYTLNCTGTATPPPVTAGVTLDSLGSITGSTVLAAGTATGAGIGERGFYWWIPPTTATHFGGSESGLIPEGYGAGNFSLNLTGLKPGNKYHVKAYVKVGGQIITSDEQLFTTATTGATGKMAPTVLTDTVNYTVSGNSITVNGEITDVGSTPVNVYGFIYAPHTAPYTGDDMPKNGDTAYAMWDQTPLYQGMKFTGTIKNIPPGNWYLRAYAHNVNQDSSADQPESLSYGEEISFTIACTPETCIPGDVNGDGNVDLADAMPVLRILAGIPVGNVNLNADVNGDGKIGLEELGYILQKVAEVR